MPFAEVVRFCMGKQNHNEQNQQQPQHVRSMHEGITEADDPCCACEPEPRWQQLAEELEREAAERSSQEVERARPT